MFSHQSYAARHLTSVFLFIEADRMIEVGFNFGL